MTAPASRISSKARLSGLHLGLLLMILGGLTSSVEAEMPRRVLFIGNSYTAMSRPQIEARATEVAQAEVVCKFFTRPGFTLKRHLSQPAVIRLIQNGDWDFVVLQDQSQTPALPGVYEQSFQEAVDQFSRLIRRAGAKPVLFETWGYLNGDPRNRERFPDYPTMQAKLSKAYRAAGQRNRATVAPVGRMWSRVRKAYPDLAPELYARDGAHPSPLGRFLASIVLIDTLFDLEIEKVRHSESVSDIHAAIVRGAILKGSSSH